MSQPISTSNSPYQVKFQYYRDSGQCLTSGQYHTIDLFLGNNPRTTYTPIFHYGYADNLAGFIFHHCIVCGKERSYDSRYERRCPPLEGPMTCENPKCREVSYNMQIEWGKDAQRLFFAIRDRHIETLNSYRVDKSSDIFFW